VTIKIIGEKYVTKQIRFFVKNCHTRLLISLRPFCRTETYKSSLVYRILRVVGDRIMIFSNKIKLNNGDFFVSKYINFLKYYKNIRYYGWYIVTWPYIYILYLTPSLIRHLWHLSLSKHLIYVDNIIVTNRWE